MIIGMNAFSRNFPVLEVKGFYKAFIIFTFPLFSLVNALDVPKKDAFKQSPLLPPAPESEYKNYAEEDLYENEPYFSAIPQWHYYDVFGNKILDGFNMYTLSKKINTTGTGITNITLHPFLKKVLDNLVEVTDLHDSSGIMVMIGDKVSSEFTPFSLKQTILSGARFDVFHKQNFLSFLTNRISNTGFYGMLSDESRPEPTSDWLTGVHVVRKFGEAAGIGGTYVNLHHEESKLFSNQFSGADSDTARKTPTGVSLYGLDVNLQLNKLQAYGEYLRSQEFLDGNFKPGFRIELHIKDLMNALNTAKELGVPVFLSSQVIEIMQALKIDGKGGGFKRSGRDARYREECGSMPTQRET